MSRMPTSKALTIFASLAALGLTSFSLGVASAASINNSVAPAMGHPTWTNNLGAGLNDQIRYSTTGTSTTGPHGGHAGGQIVPPPPHHHKGRK